MKLTAQSRWPLLILVYFCTLVASWQLQQNRFNEVSDLLAQQPEFFVDFEIRGEPRQFLSRYVSDQEQIQYSVPVKLKRIQFDSVSLSLTAPATAIIASEKFDFFRGQTLRASANQLGISNNSRSCCLLRITGQPELISEANWAYAIASKVRTGVQEAMPDKFPNGAALVPGLVLGDTSEQSIELETAMRGSGLAHLTAVSGGNVTIVLGLFIAIFMLLGVRNRGLILVAGIALSCYVLIVGFDASVLRAGAMGSITLLAVLCQRAITTGAILLSAIFALTVFNPWLWLSWGFLLSACATAGLIWLAPKLLRAMPWSPPFDLLATLIAATIAASWLTAPLLVIMTGEVPVVTVLANLIAAPLVAITTVFGLIAALISLINPELATPISFLASMPAELIGQIAFKTASLPGAQLQIANNFQLFAFLAAIALIGYWLVKSAKKTIVLLTLLGFLLCYPLAVKFWRSIDGWPPKNTFLIACDVGQGTAVLLPIARKTAVVIDTGPEPQLIDQCLTRAGITQVPLVLISHFHADHAGGVAGVVANRNVSQILTSPNLAPLHQSEAVSEIANRYQIAVGAMHAGDAFKFGDYQITAIWPISGRVPLNENDASLVLIVSRANHSFLFTGDIEPAGQQDLMKQERMTVYAALVPHHGSKFQAPGFVSWTGAKLGVISVGENRFGHPAPETIQNWEQRTKVIRTDLLGDIALVVQSAGLSAVAR